MKVAIIKYNAGNVFSVLCALKRIGIDAIVTDDPATLRAADKVIFPGVGEASSAMHYLREHRLDELIKSLSQPVLGICIGMQLLCSHSEEGDTNCLGIFDTKVRRFSNASAPELKIPHMGWNNIELIDAVSGQAPSVVDDSCAHQYLYFVHSYYAPVCTHTVASCNYITPFSAVLHKDNFHATQFHPEKSGSVGELILKNFIKL
ncbi:MAG: imidazole glycerol phosphate synthase subunit HisH [Muribaculaceae bacterium]